jgi:hypothetical protein
MKLAVKICFYFFIVIIYFNFLPVCLADNKQVDLYYDNLRVKINKLWSEYKITNSKNQANVSVNFQVEKNGNIKELKLTKVVGR